MPDDGQGIAVDGRRPNEEGIALVQATDQVREVMPDEVVAGDLGLWQGTQQAAGDMGLPPGSLLGLELVFAHTADRADEVVGHIVPRGAGGDARVGIAGLRVVEVSAYLAQVSHGRPFVGGALPSSMRSVAGTW
jgi:hypothetical protein